MRSLYQHEISRLDLKPENILIDSNYYPKITDFGLSPILKELFLKNIKLIRNGKSNSPIYIAPEILKGSQLNYSSSMYFLACLYEEGKGVQKDKIKAFMLYKEAAKDDQNVETFYNLGRHYEYGIRTLTDEKTAFQYFFLNYKKL